MMGGKEEGKIERKKGREEERTKLQVQMIT